MMDGKPLWMRGDSNRGLALWPVADGYVLSVHLDAETTDLHLTDADIEALRGALEDHNGTIASPPVVQPAASRPGPPCDRCKSPTARTPDGYACTNCGNVIVWV